MDIDVTQEDNCYTIKLGGFFDTDSSPALQQKVEDIMSETYEKKDEFSVVFDLNAVEFVSSAGLRVLLMAKKMTDRQKGKMSVVTDRQPIREVFNMTGFSKILNLQ
ncbi:MAG: STAS domain-containing protein [Synergistaceae bacterium]|nr:STAS domain-containing protein [Synergistaceae bacterium]